MRVAVLGASGRTGRQVVETLLGQGHEVTALTRKPWSRASVRVVQGDALDRTALETTVAGADAVICVIGPTASNPADVCSAATRLLIEVMRAAGVRTLVVQTGAMIGHARLGRFYRWMAERKGIAAAVRERREQERLVQESGLDWTLIRPPLLTNGRGAGAARVGDFRIGPTASVARVDLARVLARAATHGAWRHQGVAVASAFTSRRPGMVLRAWILRLGIGEMLGIAAAAAVALTFMAAFGVPTTALMGTAFLACMVAAGALEGALLGLLPGAMLKGIFPGFPLGKFTLATIVMGMVGWAAGMLPSTLMTGGAQTTVVEPHLGDVLAISAAGGAVGGALIGLVQWLVMRGTVPRAGRWVVATSLGWAVALPLDMLAGALPGEHSGWPELIGTALGFGFAAGVAVALPTGVLVVDLLRQRERRAEAGEIPASRPSHPVFA